MILESFKKFFEGREVRFTDFEMLGCLDFFSLMGHGTENSMDKVIYIKFIKLNENLWI